MRRILIAAVIVAVLAGCSPPPRDPAWDAALSPDDAFSLSLAILSQAGTKNCSEFEVIDQQAVLKRIIIECGNGKTSREVMLDYWPEFRVDRRPASTDPWQTQWLGSAYCVQAIKGFWDMAFLNRSQAFEHAKKLSVSSGQRLRIVSADSLEHWVTGPAEDGGWRINAAGEVEDRDWRFGCELEKSRL